MTKRNNEKNTGKARSEEQTLLNSAYSYYGGIVRTNGHATTAGGVRRLFAAALLSGASIVAVGLGGAGTARAGTCLPQAGPGTQILCIGDFNDTIDIDVEDVTVTLGEGSLVDTTNEEAGGYGDNIGIIVNGDGDQTVVNDGTVLTGDYFDEYGGHHGIVAYAAGGYDARAENSSTGIIGTTGEDSYGVYAATDESYEGTATAVNAGSVSTTGEGSHGVHADGKYANVENTGLVFTNGYEAHGLYAYGKYEADVYNSGEVETDGDESNGIRAIAESYFGPSDGDVTVVNAEDGIVRTSGEDSDGIFAYGDSVSVTNAGTILTYGEDADGVAIYGYSVSLTNSGSIKTYGYDTDAVRAESHGYTTTTIVNTGVIASYDEYSGGIEASGPTVRITNDVVIVDDEVVATGLIYSADDRAIDIDESDAAYLYNNGSIVGNVDIGVDEYALVDNSGSIFSDRYDETTLSINVYEGDARFINHEGGTVTATEDYSDAVNVYAEDGFADLRNYGSISTGHTVTNEIDTYVYGDNATAAYAYGEEGALVLSTGSVTTVGDGSDALYATSEYGLVQALNTGSVQTSGDNSYAVAAYAGGEEVIVGFDDYDAPIYGVYGGDAIAGNAGTVQTSGEDAYGVAAVAKYGDAFAYNVFGGSIVTSGNGAHGLVAATGTEFGDIGNYSNGEGGIAVAVNSVPDQYSDDGFFFYDEEGHVAVADFVDTEGFEPADFRSTVVTTGDFATGVLAVAGGDEQALAGNFYGDVTTGTMDEYGDATGGNYAYGVAAFSSGGDAVPECVESAGAQAQIVLVEARMRAAQPFEIAALVPVLPRAEQHSQAADLCLLLQIDAGLCVVEFEIVEGRDCRNGLAVVGIENVQRGRGAVADFRIRVEIPAVEARKDRMRHRAGTEARLKLVVDCVGGAVFVRIDRGTIERAVVGLEPRGVDALVIHFRFEIAEVLAEGEDFVEFVFEEIADGPLLSVELFPVHIAIVEIGVELPDRIRVDRSECGNGAIGTGLRVLLIMRLEGQAGAGRRPPGECRRHEFALDLRRLRLSIACARKTDEAVGKFAFVVQRACRVDCPFIKIVRADGGRHLTRCFVPRLLAHEVDETAGRRGTVENGGRAFEDFEPLDHLRRDLGDRVPAVILKLQPVEVIAIDLEAAHREHVVARDHGAAAFGRHAA